MGEKQGNKNVLANWCGKNPTSLLKASCCYHVAVCVDNYNAFG